MSNINNNQGGMIKSSDVTENKDPISDKGANLDDYEFISKESFNLEPSLNEDKTEEVSSTQHLLRCHDVLMEFYYFKMYRSETVQQYVIRFEKMISKVDDYEPNFISVDIKRDKFFTTLIKNIKYDILLREPKTYEDAVHRTLIIQKILNEGTKQSDDYYKNNDHRNHGYHNNRSYNNNSEDNERNYCHSSNRNHGHRHDGNRNYHCYSSKDYDNDYNGRRNHDNFSHRNYNSYSDRNHGNYRHHDDNGFRDF